MAVSFQVTDFGDAGGQTRTPDLQANGYLDQLRYPGLVADDEAHIIGFSAAWGVVAVIFGCCGAGVGIQTATPRSGFPWLPVILLGLATVGALYLCFATLSGWWPTRSGWWPARRARGVVASAAIPASQTTEQASEVPENESSNPVSPPPPQGGSAGPATDGPTPPSSPPRPQPKSGWKRAVKAGGGIFWRTTVLATAIKQVSDAEEFLSENADKVPGDLKSELEEAVAELKKALQGTDNDVTVEAASNNLGKVFGKTERATRRLGG
jgi:hypothetical protein